jgi:hypothetical protein
MFAIKVPISDVNSKTFVFREQKTMYGGKRIAAGRRDLRIRKRERGRTRALTARGVVTSGQRGREEARDRRQTPRVSITVRRTALANRPLGRNELKRFCEWKDGRPETELNFKLYRQATNKIVGISAEAAAFLGGFFQRPG